LVEGSAEARLHVFGSGVLPAIEGNAQLPEGAVNGLAFHDLNATVRGTPASIELGRGHVEIGSTLLAFDATLAAASQRVNVDAPHADLADFNDLFDAGDVLGGKGSIRAGVALAGGAVTETSGDVALHDAKVRSFDVGAADANWHGSGDRIATTLAFGGPYGRVSATGTVALSGGVDVTARARDVDLSQWLPMAGIVAPVTGLAQADLAVRGRYPNWDSTVNARVTDGSAGRMPVKRFEIAANTVKGRGRITSATLVVPNARVDGSGTFGLRSADTLGLVFHASTPDVAAVANTLTGKTFDAAGALTTTVRVSGTLLHPTVDDEFTLAQARYAKFDVPRAIGRIHADAHTIAVSSGEVDLRKGRVLVQGNLPIRLQPFQIDPQDRPVNAVVVVDDIEASNVAGLLPKGAAAGGRIDGRMTLAGSVRSPTFAGAVALDQGYFSGPQERVPISGATARLVLSGTTVRLQDAHANAGGGTLDADGLVSIPDVRDVDRVAVKLNLRARDARIDLPQYIKGRFNGDVSLTRVAASRPQLAGTISVDAARIPLTALYDPKASNSPSATPPDLGIDLRVAVNRDVRVVSPNVDVGTQGAVHATGTLAAPQLAGTFTSTGGTVNFFRSFVVEDATVSFDPSSGIVPDVDASATTFITNPDTNVALRVTGPATHLNLGLASDPSYDREQILGLLVGAQSFGAVRGVQSSGGSPFSTSSAVSNLAGGQLNELFTRNLLEPLSVALGGSLGLRNLQITNDVQSGLGINAVKAFGKNVSFVFADTFNEPRRQSWSLQAHPSTRTQFELTAYSSQGTSLGYRPFLVQQLDMGSAATIPLDTGTNGIDVKVKRSFP
jgi:autotransporter translocation and assembly factor TamB